MTDFSTILNRQLMLLCLIALGVVLAKVKIIDEKMSRNLSTLLVQILLPCNVVSVFMVDDYDPSLTQTFLLALVISFIAEGICFFASKYLYPFIKDEGQRGILRYGTVSPNGAYIGIPLVEGVFGSQGLLYLAAFLGPLNVFMWAFGLFFLVPGISKKEVVKKLVTQPAIIAVVVGFIVMITGFQMPSFLDQTIRGIGGCVTPLSLIITGVMLAGVNPKSVFNGPTLYYSFIRLGVIPLATLGILMLLGVPSLVTSVIVLLMAMPAAAGTVMAATMYGGDAKFGSQIMFTSTVISMVTLPLMAMLVTSVA